MLGTFSFLVCAAGIVSFFLGFWPVTVAGAVVNLISQFNEIRLGKQNNLVTAIIACFIGLALGAFTEIEWWLGICIALCFEDALLFLLGLPVLLAFFFRNIHNGKG